MTLEERLNKLDDVSLTDIQRIYPSLKDVEIEECG